MVEIIDLKRHAEILRGYHLPYPLRITMADPVPGIAQPRLADTSAFFTWPTTTLAIIVGMLAACRRAQSGNYHPHRAELTHVLDTMAMPWV